MMNIEKARKLVIANMIEDVANDFFEASPSDEVAFEKEVIAYVIDTSDMDEVVLNMETYADEIYEAYYTVLTENKK